MFTNIMIIIKKGFHFYLYFTIIYIYKLIYIYSIFNDDMIVDIKIGIIKNINFY